MIYNWILAVGVTIMLPKILLKRKLPTLRQRLGFDIPDGKEIIWIHAVSVGEVKSAKGLLEKLRNENPNTYILVTTCTATGQEEAKRSLTQANGFHFLPIDFSWIMKRWVRALQPKLLIFVETDLWYNLLKAAKKAGTKTVLVSGKMSERSFRRYNFASFFAKKIFSLIDLTLVQNEEHQKRFAPWSKNLHIGGNLKLDATPTPVDKEKWAPHFSGQNILITCTHAPEEEELLDALQEIEGTIYLAPRHPERFRPVADLLKTKQIPHTLWSQIDQKRGGERVVLIDSMGLLPIFYTLCNLTIVAGSFSSRIGGHNVLEPCLYGSPVFFGPHMDQQAELALRVLSEGAGRQSTLSSLAEDIRHHLANPHSMRLGAQKVILNSRGALERTWEYLKK